MVAEFKSHVLLRDEKGFLGIPFKRLLLAGVGGGLVYTLAKITVPDWSLLVAVVASVAIILLTTMQGGIPRWQRLLYRVRGSVILIAARHPTSIGANAAKLLELPAELVRLDAAVVFAPTIMSAESDLSEWVTFAQAVDADRDEDGLVLVETSTGVR